MINFFLRKRKGIQKKVIENKLKEYAPTKDNIWVISIDHDQVYEIKFHGKPVSKFPLKYSKNEKINENSKINEIFFSAKEPTMKIANPKNKDKNNGIKITAKGINDWNAGSWVKDIAIQ